MTIGKFYRSVRAGVLSLAFFLTVPAVKAQDSIPPQPADSFEIHKVLIIPFSPRMYVSSTDKDILAESGMTFPAMVERLRSGSAIAIRQSVPGWWESQLLSESDDSSRELQRIYASIKYSYELLDPKTMGAKHKPGDVKPEEKKIVQGQLKVEPDARPKFMNIRLKNDTLLQFLGAKYASDCFLFINQLDLDIDMSDPDKVAARTFEREVRFHYTILNKNGEQLFAGLAVTRFSAKENKLETIIGKQFPKTAKIVTSHLPPPVPVKKK